MHSGKCNITPCIDPHNSRVVTETGRSRFVRSLGQGRSPGVPLAVVKRPRQSYSSECVPLAHLHLLQSAVDQPVEGLVAVQEFVECKTLRKVKMLTVQARAQPDDPDADPVSCGWQRVHWRRGKASTAWVVTSSAPIDPSKPENMILPPQYLE